MEFTQESIDALVVNEVEIMKKIAAELNIRVQQVSAVISLINEDCTIAFISRFPLAKMPFTISRLRPPFQII